MEFQQSMYSQPTNRLFDDAVGPLVFVPVDAKGGGSGGWCFFTGVN